LVKDKEREALSNEIEKIKEIDQTMSRIVTPSRKKKRGTKVKKKKRSPTKKKVSPKKRKKSTKKGLSSRRKKRSPKKKSKMSSKRSPKVLYDSRQLSPSES
jgi:hypothetical protein